MRFHGAPNAWPEARTTSGVVRPYGPYARRCGSVAKPSEANAAYTRAASSDDAFGPAAENASKPESSDRHLA